MNNIKKAVELAVAEGKIKKGTDLAQLLWPESDEKGARANLWNLLRGKSKKIDIKAVPILCEKLGCSADYLFGISDNRCQKDIKEELAEKLNEAVLLTQKL